MGQAPKYKAEFVGQATKLCALGATDPEVADFFDVNLRTLYRWKGQHTELAAALRVGKDHADARVVRSLYQRAIGYDHDGKHYPADTTACIFWLKNRQRDDWRDKIETGITDTEGNDVGVPDLTELSRRVAFMLSRAAIDKAKAPA